MANTEDIALVVLSHGLWGVKGHMGFIEKKLIDKYGDKIHVLNSSVNEAKFSYDGVDICGERLAEDVESTVVRLGKNGKQVKKISMIGYSLGGLIVRYAIGHLGQKGFFNTIEPACFVTFATPHMGVHLPPSSVFSSIFNFVSGRLVSRSGEQLQLLDKYDKVDNKPMLEILSDPDQPYFKYLSKFKKRRTYANIANDRTVGYWTAGLELRDYFFDSKGKIDFTLDETYNSIITSFEKRLPNAPKSNKVGDLDANGKRKKRPIKPILLKYTFYLLIPILGPIFWTLALIVIGFQGLVSRYRTSRILDQKKLLITNHHSASEETMGRRSSEADRYMNGELLAGALDAVNLPGEQDSPPKKQSTLSDLLNTKTYYYNVEPSKLLDESCKPLPCIDTTKRIHKNLRLLEWERVWVYIRAFNAHGSIVCRQKRFTTDSGIATIQHFLDTTQLDL
ncbi:putative serine esterase-domain-containing protein [Mucor lusitanicus]|uniref:Putative serine esterase-domain-containing protein n=1 Tax=Mucor circinelloides f. lusitanicus TaxID=29924 RepID=A0A8H4BAW4_MUCCL|nr:putative serine esterase-domain-containing protein [Mucor lusitanicus]